MIKEGDAAPDFESRDAEGNKVKLSDLRGRKVVLYFYPKDDTPGCTKEACSFRDSHSVFEREGIKVLGVSAARPSSLTSRAVSKKSSTRSTSKSTPTKFCARSTSRRDSFNVDLSRAGHSPRRHGGHEGCTENLKFQI